MHLTSRIAQRVDLRTTFNGFAAVLLLAGVSACGTAASKTPASAGVAKDAQECPAWLQRSRFKVVYAPTEAIGLWTLPQRLLPTNSQTQELASLHSFVERVAERLTAESFNQPGRVVRYQQLVDGASVTVSDQDSARLEAMRTELDTHAEKVNAGACGLELAQARTKSDIVVSDQEWDAR